MNTILHLAGVLSTLWASIFAFETLTEPALGGALLILFFGFAVMTLAAIDDDLFLITGRKMLGFRKDEREPVSFASKMALVVTVVLLAISTYNVTRASAIGLDDQTSDTPLSTVRTGALFEPRPRRSVDSGDDVGFLVDNHGRQYVRAEIAEPLTGFGDVAFAQLTPLIQLQFPYSVNPRLVTSLTDGSGAVTVADSMLTVTTGTTTSSDALLQSESVAHYHPGQGTITRFTAIFDSSPVADTEAIIGLGNEEDFVGFGFDGTTFSILHRTGGVLEHRTITFTTGAVTQGGTITITLDGTATEVEVVNGDSVQAVARAVGAVAFSEWETLVIGTDVVFTSHHAEVKAGSFTFADTDTTGVAATGGLEQSITGVAHTDSFIPQTSWNSDKMNGTNNAGTNPSKMTLVPSKGNTYAFQLQDGFADISFFIENENTGRFHRVHRLKYANANTNPSLQNPSLPLYIAVDNEATTSAITVKTSSMAVFTEGLSREDGLNNAAFGSASGDLTTEQAVLCILDKPIFQSKENRVDFQPQRVTFSANGAGAAKSTTLKVHLNPILGGNPSFTDVSTATSVMAFDTAGTTLSGGNVTATFKFGADVELFTLNLQDDVGPLPPETLVCFGVTTDAGTTEADLGVTWRELF